VVSEQDAVDAEVVQAANVVAELCERTRVMDDIDVQWSGRHRAQCYAWLGRCAASLQLFSAV
jgi:hypothetical protein